MTEENREDSELYNNNDSFIKSEHSRSSICYRVLRKNYPLFIRLLGKIPFFKDLTIEQFQQILVISSKRFFDKG